MPVYDYLGEYTVNVYDKNGEQKHIVYDSDGNIIYLGNSLKVMNYNVGGWYTGVGTSVPPEWDEEYYNMQNHILEVNNADILGIEEYRGYFTTGERTAVSVLSPYYQYIKSEKDTNPYMGKAICSKYPFVDNSYYMGTFENESSRNFIKIGIQYNDIVLNVIVVHLATDVNKRPAQALQLLEYANTLDNVIIFGDFNTQFILPPDNRDYTNVYKPFVDARYNIGNCGRFGNFETYYYAALDEWRYLDNIITSHNIIISSAKVDDTKVTNPITEDPNWLIDHIPFICELIIPNSD